MEHAVLLLAISRIVALLIAAFIALRYKSWGGLALALILVWVVIFNTFLGYRDVASFLGTPFTFLLAYYIVNNSIKHRRQ